MGNNNSKHWLVKTSKASWSIKRWWCEGGSKKVEKNRARIIGGQ